MFKRRYVTLLPLFVLLAACSSKPKPTETETTTGTPSGGFLLEPQHNVMQMGGDFANNPNAQQFIDKMVNKHGFDRQQLSRKFSPRRNVWIRYCG
ncbi:hypothetical protein EIMP300_31140 [Escherichia coli]|uniref:Murein hydrolase B n=1 Tax=Escherichia coli TaxID=562 RepID=A0A8S0FMR6_ECOLX|nr:hypothetical protein EIMP300_31140 [Escherichia coli]